jgi:soluble lytic murein transglycosylase
VKVPILDAPQQTLEPLPGVRIGLNAPAEAFGGEAGQALAGFGQSLQSLGATDMDLMAREAAEADALRVSDGLNQVKERINDLTFSKAEGFTNLLGRDALERSGGRPLADEYRDKLDADIGKIAQGLGSERQRRLFSARAAALAEQFHGSVMRHEAEQFKSYGLSVRDGAIKNAADSIGLYWNDPERIAQESRTIRASVYDAARLSGKSAEWAEAQTRELTSRAHVSALSAALDAGSTDYAKQYLARFGGEMAADDLLKARGLLEKTDRQRTALTVASGVTSQLVQTGGDMDRLWNLVIQRESGGLQSAVSPKGARGVAQIMPGTWDEARRLAGLPEDASIDNPAHNEAAGKAYFAKQLQTFGGDLAKALAAYNMGPGDANKGNGVSGLVAKYGDDWLAHAPTETRNYVHSILQQYQSGLGAAELPSLEALQQQALSRLGKNADPETVKDTLAEVARQYEVHQKAIKADQDQAESTAYKLLFANGGDLTALSPSLLAKVPGDKLDSMRNFATQLAKGEEPKTDWARFADLMNEAATQPDTFAQRDLTLEAPHLARAELKQLIERQAKIKGGTDAQYHVASEEGQIAAIVKELKLNKEQTGKFTSAAIRELQAAAARNGGKRVSPEEERKILDRLILEGEVPGRIFDTEGRAFEFYGTPDQSRFVPDIPESERPAVEAAVRRLGQMPTPENMAAVYKKAKGL